MRLKGAAELIEFQYFVRIPTTKLIFKPLGPYPTAAETETYMSSEHKRDPDNKTVPQEMLSDDLKEQYYPDEDLQQGNTVTLLQAHSGGLFAHAKDSAYNDTLVQQHQGSSQWHKVLDRAVDTAAETLVSTGSARPLKQAILNHYTDTIWQGLANFSDKASRVYPEYYFSPASTTGHSYDDLRRAARGNFTNELTRMSKQMTKVLAR